MSRMLLTLNPVATDWTEEVGIQTMRFLYFVQQLSNVHHLQRCDNWLKCRFTQKSFVRAHAEKSDQHETQK